MFGETDRKFIRQFIEEQYGGFRLEMGRSLTGETGRSLVLPLHLFGRAQAEQPERTLIVKVARYDKLEREIENFKKYLRPLERPAFFVEPKNLLQLPTTGHGALVYQYAKQLGPRYADLSLFREFCEGCLADAPEKVSQVIHRLFAFLAEIYNHPDYLKVKQQSTYQQVCQTDEKFGHCLLEAQSAFGKLLGHPETLHQPTINLDGISLENPMAHQKDLLEKEFDYLRCGLVFGDLNTSNILVLGQDDIGYVPCLIDHERMAEERHLAYDFAHLEVESVHHVIVPYLLRQLEDEGLSEVEQNAVIKEALLTYQRFASGLHVATPAGFEAKVVEKAAAAFVPPNEPFLQNTFQLLCHIRKISRDFLREPGDFGYASEDYMTALYFDALLSLRYSNLTDVCKRFALITASTAAAYVQGRNRLPVISLDITTLQRYQQLEEQWRDFYVDLEEQPTGRVAFEFAESVRVDGIRKNIPVRLTPGKVTQEKDFSSHYLEKFGRFSFFDLLRGSEEIETGILRDIQGDVESALMSVGYRKRGKKFENASGFVEFTWHQTPCPGGYSLSIMFEMTPVRRLKPLEPPLRVKQFGRIREINIISPVPPPLNLEKLVLRIGSRVNAAYSALERVFTRKTSEVNRKVFSNVYDLVATRMQSQGKEHLIGRFWLIVANDDFVVYFFDEEELRRTIKHYKTIAGEVALGLSPFELTSIILTKTFPFKKSLAIEAFRQGKVQSLPWVKAKYIDQAPLIHRAEELLYNSDNYSGYVPCEVRNHYLIVGCPQEITNDVMPEIQAIRPTLCHQFREGLAEWSAYISMVSLNDLV